MDSDEQIVAMLRALGNPVRWEIFLAIAQLETTNRTAIALETGYLNTAWHHISILVKSGLVLRDEIDTKDVLFSINKDALQLLAGVLGEIATQ